MAVTESVVEVGDCLQLENGHVVRVVGETREQLTLERFETMERFPVRRGPFEDDVRSGHIQAVEAEWTLVGDERETNR